MRTQIISDFRALVSRIGEKALMTVWKIVIRHSMDEADRRQGWALAQTQGDALALADDPDAVAIETNKAWPGPTAARFFWSN